MNNLHTFGPCRPDLCTVAEGAALLRWVALASCLALAACSGSGGSSSSASGGNNSDGTGGTGGTVGEGGSGSSDYVADPGLCDAGKCNGRCLAKGEAESGCKFIGNIGSVTLAAAPDGTLYSAWYGDVYELTLAPPTERVLEADATSFSELAVSATHVFAGAAPTGEGVVAYQRSDDAKTVLDAEASDVAEMQIVGDTVYYQVDDFLGGAIKSVTATSTAPTALVEGNGLGGLYADSSHLYWSQETENSSFMHLDLTLQRAPLGELTKTEVLATGTTAEKLVGNDTTLFWTTETVFYAVPKSGGTPVQVSMPGSGVRVECATSAGAIVFEKEPNREQMGRLLLVDSTGKVRKLADMSSADDCVVANGRLYVQQANVGLYEVTLP